MNIRKFASFASYLAVIALLAVAASVYYNANKTDENAKMAAVLVSAASAKKSASEACADIDAAFDAFLVRRYREDLNTFSEVVTGAGQTDDEAVGAAARQLFEMGAIAYQYPGAPMSITVSALSRIMHGELAAACADTDHPIPTFVPTTIND